MFCENLTGSSLDLLSPPCRCSSTDRALGYGPRIVRVRILPPVPKALSSAAERLSYKQLAGGSNPSAPTNPMGCHEAWQADGPLILDPWGHTTVAKRTGSRSSKPVVGGSNPPGGTRHEGKSKVSQLRLTHCDLPMQIWRNQVTRGTFNPGDGGSIPSVCTQAPLAEWLGRRFLPVEMGVRFLQGVRDEGSGNHSHLP